MDEQLVDYPDTGRQKKRAAKSKEKTPGKDIEKWVTLPPSRSSIKSLPTMGSSLNDQTTSFTFPSLSPKSLLVCESNGSVDEFSLLQAGCALDGYESEHLYSRFFSLTTLSSKINKLWTISTTCANNRSTLKSNFSSILIPTKTANIQAGLLTASQEIDAAIAQLGVPLAKLPSTPEETSRIIKAVTERRDQTSNDIAQPATAAAKHNGTKPKQPTKRKSSPDTQLDNTRARRSTDKNGFSAPPRHLIARGTHYMPTSPNSKLDSTTNSFFSLTNMTNSEMADDADPPEQPPRHQGFPLLSSALKTGVAFSHN
ncbi:hypothetical protein CEXT_789111 [Caerostris extrusa]|uniref:Uncharacterized protein n=1 Tax=Caerostris extrusa TaxID=172846 RepID=A0AAV4TX03_CAEEX|nr:hypothetical protein CEXT_789111 [Caerostris extrusa]